jgi:purine-binding chemotaxis protein CheW
MQRMQPVAERDTAHAAPEHLRRVLEKRARALARPLRAEEPADTVELVVMVLGPERYGVNTEHVREVLALADLTRVPGTPAFWAGIVNVRGTLYPVLDLRRYLTLPDGDAAEGPVTVVLVFGAGVTIGIKVDDAPEVRRVPAAAIGPALAGTPEAARVTVRGVTDDLLGVLDIEALLANSTLVVREEPT